MKLLAAYIVNNKLLSIIKMLKTFIQKNNLRFLTFAITSIIFMVIFSKISLAATTTYTTSGTWIAPVGATSVVVQAWGGGGAGGGTIRYSSAAGGGGGGEYRSSSLGVTSTVSYTITVGTGGAGAAGKNGGNGGASIFAASSGSVIANGGIGGNSSAGATMGARGAGGAGGTGTTYYIGGSGANGITGTSGYGGGGGEAGSSNATGTNASGSGAGKSANDGGDGSKGTAANSSAVTGSAPGGGGGGSGYKSSSGSLSGGSGARGQVIVTWMLMIPNAPTNVAATDGSSPSTVTVTWTKSAYASGYYVYEGSNLISTLGDVSTFDDDSAPAATITTAGTAAATDGTSPDYVTLALSGTAVSTTTRTYKVIAFNDSGSSADSNTDTGYRGAGTMTYQWQRSAADSNASYSSITSGTGVPYNDTGAPSSGDGRYYQCIVTMGSSSQVSTPDRGYRAPPAPITFSGTIFDTTEIGTFPCLTSGPLTVKINVNNTTAYVGSCSANTGVWSASFPSTLLGAGSTVVAYISGGSVRGSTVLIASSTSPQTGVPIIQNRVVLNKLSGSLTMGEIGNGDTSDSDDLFTVSGGSYLTPSMYETHVIVNNGWALGGGNVTTGKLHNFDSVVGTLVEKIELTSSGTGTSRPFYTEEFGQYSQIDELVFSGSQGNSDIETPNDNIHYPKLTINVGTATATILNSGTIQNVTVSTGSLDLLSYTIDEGLSGTLTVSNGATLKIGGTNSLPTYNTKSIGVTSTVEYYGTTQTIASATYGSLVISGLGTKTLGGNARVSSDLTVSSGSFSISNFTVNRTSVGGTLTVSNGAVLNIGGTASLPTNYAAHSMGVTSTVEYSGTAQTVGTLTSSSYGNLTISGSGNKSISGAIQIAGNFTLSAGSFTDGGNQVSGNSSGTLSAAAGTDFYFGNSTNTTFPTDFTTAHISLNASNNVRYVGTSGTQAVSGVPTYGNLYINGTGTTKSLSQSGSVAGNLTLNTGACLNLNQYTLDRTANGGTLTTSSNSKLIIGGSNTLPSNYQTHSFNSSSTFEYADTSIITTPNSSQNYPNLIISGNSVTTSSSFGITSSLTVNTGASLVASSGSVGFESNGTISNSGNLIFYDFGVGNGVTVTTSSSFNLTHDWAVYNGGSFTASAGTIGFIGGDQTIYHNGTGISTFYGLNLANGKRTIHIEGSDLANKIIVASGGHLTMQGAGPSDMLTLSTANDNWYLRVDPTATIDTVSYVSVSKSDATEYKTIDASNETNYNGGDNLNWLWPPSPHVVLTSPNSGIRISDTTPTLYFRGTDDEGDDIRYKIQIDTSPNFDSQGTGVFDNFDDHTISSDWTLSEYGAWIDETGGELVINLDNVSGHGAGLYTTSSFNFTGKRLSSKVSSAPPENIATVVKVTSSDDQSQLQILEEGGNIKAKVISGGTEATRATATYDSSSMRYWSIREFAGVILWEYSRYGEDWTLLWSEATPINITSLHAQIESVNWSGNTPSYNPHFDDINYGKTPLLTKISGTNNLFTDEDRSDTDPFYSGDDISYTVQNADGLGFGTYYWRVIGIDPGGANQYGYWSQTFSFITAPEVCNSGTCFRGIKASGVKINTN